ncbi:MAG: 1-acyl-sn-glycerol-3-phosphate acyltransferase [Bacteroidales bacterium]|nr:1-acyl-sn-glycerol-3-phosphate acyltransferase [Bacteroidales bacterium]MDZ4203285.1 1-acyl-sn-glycerol-3-phosphate acyltransferase [Bacteroidales bacterium]
MKNFATENIHRWSIAYHWLKKYVDLAFRQYYKITITGLENIPFNEPLIFTPNHQNALMDALAVLTMRTWQPVFLSRGDIFQNPRIRKILTFCKMIPVFRMRDGYHTVQLNDETFRNTRAVLKNCNGLVILPEGNHLGTKKLRPLKKGVARIALQSQEDANHDLRIKIVPVGLEFSNYKLFGSPLLIRLGEPVAVEPYIMNYRENPARGINLLMDTLRDGMIKEMIHIEDEQNHDTILSFVHLLAYHSDEYKKLKPGTNQRFEHDKQAISYLENLRLAQNDLYIKIIKETESAVKALRQQGLKADDIIYAKSNMAAMLTRAIILIASFPVFAWSFANNVLPIALARWFGSRFKDPHFIPSARFVAGLVALPVFWLLQILVIGLNVRFGWTTVAYMATLPLTALVVYQWRKQFYIMQKQVKFNTIPIARFPLFLRLTELSKRIRSFGR